MTVDECTSERTRRAVRTTTRGRFQLRLRPTLPDGSIVRSRPVVQNLLSILHTSEVRPENSVQSDQADWRRDSQGPEECKSESSPHTHPLYFSLVSNPFLILLLFAVVVFDDFFFPSFLLPDVEFRSLTGLSRSCVREDRNRSSSWIGFCTRRKNSDESWKLHSRTIVSSPGLCRSVWSTSSTQTLESRGICPCSWMISSAPGSKVSRIRRSKPNFLG